MLQKKKKVFLRYKDSFLKKIEHLAIIMDGNGRWAQMRGRPRTYGHIKGTRVAKKIIQSCSRRGLKYLTLYAFSTENWMRPKAEVSTLMQLLQRYLQREADNLVRENIRFKVIGDLSKLPENILNSIEFAINKTSACTGMNLIFALSYGARQEIVNAAKSLAKKVAINEISIDAITEKTFESQLSTYSVPDPDLVIRTSGELRVSNFLLWQLAYSELYFTDKLWPDFTEKDLFEALEDFSRRTRRFGKTGNQIGLNNKNISDQRGLNELLNN